MKYNVLNTAFYEGDLIEKLLKRSGIDCPDRYASSGKHDLIPYDNLENIDEAYDIYDWAVKNNVGIGLVVDPDADGVYSSSILYNYLMVIGENQIFTYHQSGKEHGIDSVLDEVVSDVKSGLVRLLIVADAGTNDVESCKFLNELGCKIIIIDHHESEKSNPHATIINPQISQNYENKHLSGTAVVWKFLQKIDDENWTNHADKYVDLVAMSIISDSMDIMNLENRAIINIGFQNIQNKMLKALIDKQSYSLGGDLDIIGVQFFISPLVNAMIRSGSMEEKKLMFDAFCELDQEFDYEKRDKSIVKETIYERVARLCSNAKSRQDRQVEKAIEIVEKDIVENNRNKNKILFCMAQHGENEVDKTLTGLVAMKLAAKYNKPVVLLRSNQKGFYSGSGRNFNDSPLKNMKGFLQSLGSYNFLQGHSEAFGASYSKTNLVRTIDLSNEKLKDFDFEKIYNVDFVFDEFEGQSPSTDFIREVSSFKKFVGQGISEPLILLKNIQINSSKISIFGKTEKDTWKFQLDDKIDIIAFRRTKDDEIMDKFGGEEFNWEGTEICLDLICKCSVGDYNGERTYLLIVEDYELKETI